MSFTNNFLKALQEKGVSATKDAGGSTPSAYSENSPSGSSGNSYTSNFLSALQKQKNMTISERAEARAQTILKKQQEQARTPAGILHSYGRNNSGPTTSGGYYSRPDLGSASKRLYGNITALEPVLTEKRATLDTAKTSLVQAETDLKTVQGYLQQARAVYDADPTNENATSYNQIVGAYNLAYDAYASAFKTYSTAYDAYKPYEDQLIDALAIYQLYSNQQQAAFEDWRGTIRDAETVRQEIDAIDTRIAELKKEDTFHSIIASMTNAADATAVSSSGLPITIQNQIGENQAEIAKLEQERALLQEEYDWSRYYYYADNAKNSDFKEKKKYVSTENRNGNRALNTFVGNYSDAASGWDDPLYEYINGNEAAGAFLKDKAAAQYGSDDSIGGRFAKDYARETGSKTEAQQMSEDEVAIFNYLYATKGKEAAYEYYGYLQQDLNARQREKEEEAWKAFVGEHPYASSGFSVLMSPMKGLSYLGQTADYLTDGKIDQNAAYNKFAYVPGSIRAKVSQKIEESGKWGKVGSFAYQTAMSMADFVLNAVVGGNEAVTLAIMGTGAAADATIEAKDRGLSDNQAFLLGTIAGAAEVITEKVSLEKLLDPDLLKNGIGKYIIKNMLAEGSEEVGSDVINLIADILISRDESEWQKSIDGYVADGKTEEQAFGLAIAEQAATMGLDFLGGVISGGIMSGVNAGIHANRTNQMGNELGELDLDEEDIQAFIETGLESDPETASYQLAVEMQAKIEAGEALSNYDLARLYQANMQAVQEEAAEDLTDDNQTDAVAGDVTDPAGLSLPSVENDTRAPGFVTHNDRNGTQTQVNDTAMPDGVPLSIEDQLRQEQAQNGGTQNERNYERATGSATAQPAGELYLPGGAGISDGGAERNAGAGTAEQTGVLASSPEQRSTAYADRSRATVARQNYARSLRLEKVSSLDLGLQNGTEARNIQVIPQENWDTEMSQLADRIYNETGKGVTYVMGRIQIRGTGGTVGYARGVITGDRIIVQADHLRIHMEQIADHEAYHAKVDFTQGRLNDEIRRHIVETFSEEQLRQVLDKYIVGMRGVIDVNETHTRAEFEAAVRQIEEEIFADAYAGINAFGAGADRFTGAVNEKMDQLYMGKLRNQENGVRETGAPPAQRFSIDTINGENESYGMGVILDTDVFDGVRTREWGTVLGKYVYFNLAGTELTVYDEQGNKESIFIAKSNDRVTKDGAKNNHKVIDKLARYRGDNIKALATVHLSELLATSRRENTTSEHNHQWLDENGWEHRKTFIQDKSGNIYEATLNIANGRDRRILYDINNVRLIDKKRVARGAVPSTNNGRGSLTKSNSPRERITESGENVKERFSYAGENANNADLDALARAKEMKAAGVADETIRQQTGWHTGMDGKWRWEIDDSGMEYSGRGDLGLRERRPEYARYRELLDKANRHALELSDEALTPEETAELQKLKNIWGGTIRKAGRITEDALPTELLSDYVKHDALFEAYPQLRKTRLRFADLPEGTRGQYDPEQDIITLSNKLRGKPQDTLVHEIQHVIQKAEGFAQGSSPEFWDGQQVVPPEYAREIQKAEDTVKKVEAEFHQEWPDDINLNLVKQYIELDNQLWGDGTDPIALQELADQMDQIEQLATESGWGDLFNDYYYAVGQLQMAKERAKLHRRTSIDLYRNTAGEIEARDAASRRQLTAEQRRNTAPVRADDHTVFVEDVDDLGLQLGDRFSVDDADDQVAIGDLQAELYQLQHQRRSLLEADTAYAAAADNLRYANTFTEKVAARKAMAAAAANIDTAAIDQRISDLNEQISEIRNRETRRHREDQEKYSGTKTAGYSTMPDTRLKDLDQDYMKAVRSGDRTRMAELVEQAAEAAMPASVVRDKSGRLLKTYHHTGSRFTVFDRNMARTGTEMDGFFFAPDPESTSEYGTNMVTAYLNITKLAMDPKLDRKFNDSGTLLREKLAYQGYDGVARTENGEIYEYMTFDPEQIKSADPVVYDDRGRVIPLSERFNFHKPDIRYSVDDEGSQQAQEQKPAAPKKKISPVAESRPIIAKKDLRSTVLNLFSIPNGQRAELGTMIDSYADRLIKNGSLTEDDRKAFFDRMYDAGVMVMPAEEYSAFARSNIVDGRIYVSDSVKSDFGDDWADIRHRAFAAGVYLVNDRSASGIDQWNATLSAEDMLPGLFDSQETDERTILERIIQVAEEGKDEHLSLAEYTRRLSQQEGISEDEFLDNMERQLDWALRTFAEKARLEVHLRDRTGRKIEQEREKGNQRMTRQQAKEAQRRADERQARKDSARRAKERRELRELQQRTLKQLQWLSKNRNRAPEELQATWDEVLGDIDLYAISAADEMRWSDKHNATWKDLAQMYKDAMKNDPNFLPSKELERIVTRLDATKIADMDLGALQDLYKAAIGLRTEFYNRNNVINDEMQRLFAEVYTDAKREIESAPGENSAKKGKVSGWADKLLNIDQLTPMNVLQRMGGWDPDGAFYSMAKQLERGERDMRAYSVKAQKMLQDFLTEHEDWAKKADGQGKDGIWYKIEIPELVALELGKTPKFGDTIEVWMTPMQKIHMYLESKNQDNLRHMTGGRTFADKQLYSEGKRQEAFAQGKTVRMAPETVKAIVKDLTAEEMELARILDRYYNTFATQEINKVSNILYGYDKAMGKNYAPIYTNRNYTKTEFGVFDTTAEGVGNLKGRQYAVNPSYNISAFDAFERHVDQTARFCGMAIPARNWTTLMNWREKNNSTGDVITHKWGEESKKYIENLITTLQAGDDAKSDTVSSGIEKLKSNYISAVFGTNPSIVLKQLGSIPMASAYLDFKNFPSVSQIRSIDRSLISKYTQDLEWRTMGYSMPETKHLKDNPNWTQSNKVFGFVFGGDAITAMDGWAASTLWPWAENKVRREHPELKIGTQDQVNNGESEFYKKVAEEFENAVARSQSTSDEIHQGTLRKSKNPFTRALTMFRSDSAQTYNAIRQKIGEAQYYARTGNDQQAMRAAKRAVGSAFMSAVVGYMWAEGIEFLMNLWKHKGKKYRDDDDELTAQSIMGEMVSGLVGDMAGIVVGGEELYDFIGGVLTDGTWFGIETMGMEQLNDCLEALWEAAVGIRDVIIDAKDILENGGDIGDYFRRHGNEMLGGIKDLAKAVTTYFSGLPVNNVEAYLLGTVKWVSPELGTAYDDLFSDAGKNDLSGLEGDALEGRIGRILSDRNVSESDDTAAALAALYEAGHKTAIPSDTPTSVTIDGEKQTLGAYQQQAYDTIWGGIVADALDDMVASDSFKEADQSTRAKMLSNLYTYAAEQAKAELFDEYEIDSGDEKNATIVAAGATVAECITWNTTASEMKSDEKSAELASWDIPESAKREIFRSKISDSRDDSIAAFDEAGLSFDQFLQAYSMYGKINNEDLKAGMKAVEFSHWVNAQGYTAEQAAVVKDELTYFNMTPASSSRYDELVGAGMDPGEAYDLTGALNELQPEDGEDEVSDLQKWRASVDFSDDVKDQLAALSAVMTDAQFQKVEIANNFGVSPDAYVTLQEIKSQYDADGNGSYKNAEIQAAVDGMPGYYTTEQKAVLWQLATGSTSARNNPYSRKVGQQVLDARAAAKEAPAQEQTDTTTDSKDDESFSKALLNQLLGRG